MNYASNLRSFVSRTGSRVTPLVSAKWPWLVKLSEQDLIVGVKPRGEGRWHWHLTDKGRALLDGGSETAVDATASTPATVPGNHPAPHTPA